MNIHPYNAIGKIQMKFIIKEGRDKKNVDIPGIGTGTLIST